MINEYEKLLVNNIDVKNKQKINLILNKCGFDGVDFDIEDQSYVVPNNFATNTASLINTLKSLNNNLNILLLLKYYILRYLLLMPTMG